MSEAEKELRSAVRALQRAPVGKRSSARARIRAAVVDLLKEGMPQTEVVRLSRYSRERIRQIARDAGIEAPPEQRAKGRPKQTPLPEQSSPDSSDS